MGCAPTSPFSRPHHPVKVKNTTAKPIVVNEDQKLVQDILKGDPQLPLHIMEREKK